MRAYSPSLGFCTLALACLLKPNLAQLSGGVAIDGHISIDGNKYMQNQAADDDTGV